MLDSPWLFMNLSIITIHHKAVHRQAFRNDLHCWMTADLGELKRNDTNFPTKNRVIGVATCVLLRKNLGHQAITLFALSHRRVIPLLTKVYSSRSKIRQATVWYHTIYVTILFKTLCSRDMPNLAHDRHTTRTLPSILAGPQKKTLSCDW